MKFQELETKEFERFAVKHELANFHQTDSWANLKKSNGWDSHFVGVVDENNKILAASLILSKKLILGKKMFYAPRGFLIDYNNYKLLAFFTNNIKKYVKKKNGIFIKIDPYLPYIELDINGNKVPDGFSNRQAVNNLKKLKYRHNGFNKELGKNLQPSFIFWLPLKEKSIEQVWDNFSKDTKRHINHANRELLEIEEVGIDNIDDFAKIMEHTSKRRGFIDRPKKYYIEMIKSFKDKIKILSSVIYIDKAIKYWESERDKLIDEKKQKEIVVSESGSKKSKDALKQISNELDTVLSRLSELSKMKDENDNENRIVLASSMFICYGKEVIYLFSGSYEPYMKYNAQYQIQWEMIKYAINNHFERYNFYGIDGNLNKDDKETYGVYEFKRGFDGTVVEFIGEFDLIINKPLFYGYQLAFKTYRKLKHIKLKIPFK